MNTLNLQPSFTRNIVHGFCIWGIGWLVFAIMEALLNLTRGPILHLSTVLMTISAYTIAGAVGGMIAACLQQFLKTQQTKYTKYFRRRYSLLHWMYYFYPALRRSRHH